MGAALVFARHWDPAIEQLRRAIELDPNFWFSHCFLGRAYEQKGRLAEAIVEFQRTVELEKDNVETWSALGDAYAVWGNRAEAQKILDHLKEVSAHGWVAPYNVAVIYAGLGDKDRAFALLEQAYKTGPIICLPIWRPTLAWIASAPTRASGDVVGALD